MGLPQLDNLVRVRQLKAEAAAQSEIDGLIRSGKARLKDAQTESLSLDGRFDLAYNAAHARAPKYFILSLPSADSAHRARTRRDE
jgi:hypothetical protein